MTITLPDTAYTIGSRCYHAFGRIDGGAIYLTALRISYLQNGKRCEKWYEIGRVEREGGLFQTPSVKTALAALRAAHDASTQA